MVMKCIKYFITQKKLLFIQQRLQTTCSKIFTVYTLLVVRRLRRIILKINKKKQKTMYQSILQRITGNMNIRPFLNVLFVQSYKEKGTCHCSSPSVCHLNLSVTPTWHPAGPPGHRTCCQYRPRCSLLPSRCCCHCQTQTPRQSWHSQHPITCIKQLSRPNGLYLISFSRSRFSRS